MSSASIEEIEFALISWGLDAATYIDSHRGNISVRNFAAGWEVTKKTKDTATIEYIPFRAGIEWRENLGVARELGKLVSWSAAQLALSDLLRAHGPSPVWVEELPTEMTIALVLLLPFVGGFDGTRPTVSVDRERLPSRVTECVTLLSSAERYSTRWVIPLAPEIDSPIELEANVFLTTQSPEDLVWSLNLDILRPPNHAGFTVAPSQYRYAVLEVLHGDNPEGELTERYGRLLDSALALTMAQPVLPAGYFSALRLPPPPTGSLSESRHVALSPSSQQWSRTLIDEFTRAWHAVQNAPNPIKLALRRLARTVERSVPEDTTIDLMIAAEALYLSKDEGELSYRLSLRAALWLDASSPEECLKTMKLFQSAYSMRSKVAHGNTLKPDDEIQLRETNDQVLRVLKVACWKALEASAQGKWPPKWDELVFQKDASADRPSCL
ncbi:HEPN domain-containing protein [Cryobacterium sp. Hb1]|uniref:HEPN domain-containing protein n=1 Tax=Cryobacterium sp. Hb1 TaxID=1259147 RepID=UPI00106CBE9D|nr:HEPN domain-containing protein [Cryobacterium sp. Hb1]TFD72137.1 hypothetical protein E3T38_01180 [Cryobacterium sp. Hb1]